MQIKTTESTFTPPLERLKLMRLITSGSGRGMEQSELSHVLCNANVFKIIPSLEKILAVSSKTIYIYLTDQFNWVVSQEK